MNAAKRRMIRFRWARAPEAVIVCLSLVACAANPEPLNSERIAEKFGSYGIEILPGNERERRANLYSLSDGQPVTRTYAIVRFNTELSAAQHRAIDATHARILSGASIGASFRQDGWHINKVTRYVGNLYLADTNSRLACLMHLTGPQSLAMHSYRFQITKGRHTIDYATITEIHHPDYLDRAQLAKMFRPDTGYARSPAASETAAQWVTQAQPGTCQR